MFKETLKFNIKIYHLFLFLLFLSFSLFLFLSFSPPGGLKNFIRHLVGYHQTTLLIPMAKETLKFNIKMYHLFLFLLFLSFSFFLFLCFFLSQFLSYFLSPFLSLFLYFSLSPPGGLKNFIRQLVAYHQTSLLIPMAKDTIKFKMHIYHPFLFQFFHLISILLFLSFSLSLFLSFSISLFLATWWVKELYTPPGGLPPNITSYPHDQRDFKI